MEKKKLFVGMLAIAITFGFLFTACDTSTTDADGGGLGGSTVASKTVSVTFDIKNGGDGLESSQAVITLPDGSEEHCATASGADDYTISFNTSDVPIYLWVYWMGSTTFPDPIDKYIKAKLLFLDPKVTSKTIVIKYGHTITTENLYGVQDGDWFEFFTKFSAASKKNTT